jgi:hypothetical protein
MQHVEYIRYTSDNKQRTANSHCTEKSTLILQEFNCNFYLMLLVNLTGCFEWLMESSPVFITTQSYLTALQEDKTCYKLKET